MSFSNPVTSTGAKVKEALQGVREEASARIDELKSEIGAVPREEMSRILKMALVGVLVAAVTVLVLQASLSISPLPISPPPAAPLGPPSVAPNAVPGFNVQLNDIVTKAMVPGAVWTNVLVFLKSLRHLGAAGLQGDAGVQSNGLQCIASMTGVMEQWAKCRGAFAELKAVAKKDSGTDDAEQLIINHDISFKTRPTFLLAAIRLNIHQLTVIVSKLFYLAESTADSPDLQRSVLDKFLFSEESEQFNSDILELNFFIARHRALIGYARDASVVWQAKVADGNAEAKQQRAVLAMLRTVLASNDRMETGLAGMMAATANLGTKAISCEALAKSTLEQPAGSLYMFVDGALGMATALSAKMANTPSAATVEFLSTLAFLVEDNELPLLYGKYASAVTMARSDTMEIAGARLRRALCDVDRDIGWNLLCHVKGLEPMDASFLAGIEPSPSMTASYRAMIAGYARIEELQKDLNAQRSRFSFSGFYSRYNAISQVLGANTPVSITYQLEQCRALSLAVERYQRDVSNAVCQSTTSNLGDWNRIETKVNSSGEVSVVFFTELHPNGKSPVLVSASATDLAALFASSNVVNNTSGLTYPIPGEGLKQACTQMDGTGPFQFRRVLDEASWSDIEFLGTLMYYAPTSAVDSFASALEIICRFPLFLLEIEATIEYLSRAHDEYYTYVLPQFNSQQAMQLASDYADNLNRVLVEEIRKEIDAISNRVIYQGDVRIPIQSPSEVAPRSVLNP